MMQSLYRWLPAFGLMLVDVASYLAWAGLGAAPLPAGPARHYKVDHTAAFYLIDPRGRPQAVFSPPRDAARMASDEAELAR